MRVFFCGVPVLVLAVWTRADQDKRDTRRAVGASVGVAIYVALALREASCGCFSANASIVLYGEDRFVGGAFFLCICRTCKHTFSPPPGDRSRRQGSVRVERTGR